MSSCTSWLTLFVFSIGFFMLIQSPVSPQHTGLTSKATDCVNSDGGYQCRTSPVLGWAMTIL